MQRNEQTRLCALVVASFLACAVGPVMAQAPPEPIEIPAGTPVGASGGTHGMDVYNGALFPLFTFGIGGEETADDLHLTSAGNLASFDFTIISFIAASTTTAVVNFYANDPTDSIFPPAGLIASFTIPNLPTNVIFTQTVDVVTPVALPQDVWMGVTVGQPFDNAGLTVTIIPPTIGFTHDVLLVAGAPLPFGLSANLVVRIEDDPDPDMDGIENPFDNCPFVFNPSQLDSDGDGNGDVCDLCPGFDDNFDSDGDSVPDACDLCLGNDALGDSDGDGVCDDLDACPGFPDFLDADGDGVADGCDLCPGFDDNVDSDGDGVPDGCDICFGDDAFGDSDADGVCDDLDICPGFDDFLDADGDGVPDGCDVCPDTFNPEQLETVACISIIEDGGACLETEIDLLGVGLDGEVTILERQGSVLTLVSVTPYLNSQLPETIDISALADGEYTLCVSTQGLIACVFSAVASDQCSGAQLIAPGVYTGSTVSATNDGSASCGASASNRDVWYGYVPAVNGVLDVDTFGPFFYDTVLSIHSDCPGTSTNQLVCNDDFLGLQSRVVLNVVAGETYYIRVSGFLNRAGNFVLNVSGPPCGGPFVLENCQDFIKSGENLVGINGGCGTSGGSTPPTCIVKTTVAEAQFLSNAAGSFVVTEGATITVDFCGFDVDGDLLTASVSGLPGATLSVESGPQPLATTLSWTPSAADKVAAPYTPTVTFTDPSNATVSCSFVVEDVNLAPVCSVVSDDGVVTVECDASLTAVVTLVGSATDADDAAANLSFTWAVPDTVEFEEGDELMSSFTGVFQLGITTVTLCVADGRGGLDFCSVSVFVQDTTPPEVFALASPLVLWPPNHKMVEVSMIIEATDVCNLPEFIFPIIVTVSSNERDNANGHGDGNTTEDVKYVDLSNNELVEADAHSSPVDVTAAFEFDAELGRWVGSILLRAERDGDGDGRRYTIWVTAFDSEFNFAETSSVVFVPHDRRPEN